MRPPESWSPTTQDSLRFTREEHLKGRNEIREVFGRGKRSGCGGAKLFMLKNGLPHNRVCFTCARGFGNAVERNRARRLGREAYRNLKPRLDRGYDMILLVYPENSASAPRQQRYAGRVEQMKTLFGRAGILR